MNTPNPGPWEYENVPDRRERSAHGQVRDVNGRILFDSLNANSSHACEIMREDDGEGGVNYYDVQAEANLTLAAAAPALLAACRAANELIDVFVRVLSAKDLNSNLVEDINNTQAILSDAIAATTTKPK